MCYDLVNKYFFFFFSENSVNSGNSHIGDISGKYERIYTKFSEVSLLTKR